MAFLSLHPFKFNLRISSFIRSGRCLHSFSISDHRQSWSCLILLMFSVFLSRCVSISHFHISFEVYNVTPSRQNELCTNCAQSDHVYLFSHEQTKQSSQVTMESKTCLWTKFYQCRKTVGKAVFTVSQYITARILMSPCILHILI